MCFCQFKIKKLQFFALEDIYLVAATAAEAPLDGTADAPFPAAVWAACLGALGLRLRAEGSCGTIPSSTAFTTIPPDEPPQEARDLFGENIHNKHIWETWTNAKFNFRPPLIRSEPDIRLPRCKTKRFISAQGTLSSEERIRYDLPVKIMWKMKNLIYIFILPRLHIPNIRRWVEIGCGQG